MNGTAQRERHTAITDLRADVEIVVEGAMTTMSRKLAEQREAWTAEIAAEHAHIVRLEQSQASAMTLALSRCDERWHETAQAQKRIFDRLTVLSRPTFWGRLNWLVFGR